MEENMPVQEGNKELEDPSRRRRRRGKKAQEPYFEKNFRSIFMEFIDSIAKVTRNRYLI